VSAFFFDQSTNNKKANSQPIVIEVCENKHCCKHYTGKAATLVQTLRQIIPGENSYDIQSSGCLSNCKDGPNIQIHKNKNTILHNGITSPHVAAAVLELNDDKLKIHPTFLAACQVMDRAEEATTLDEKKRNLDSVIGALNKNSDNELSRSKCMAHALVLRARAILDFSSFDHLDEAREDIRLASELDPHHSTVWRVMADIELESDGGRAPYAIQALQRWAQYQPQFATKVNREIQRINDDDFNVFADNKKRKKTLQ